jgi:hypothetical protein
MKNLTLILIATNLAGCSGLQYAMPSPATEAAWRQDLAQGRYTLTDQPKSIVELRHGQPTGRTFQIK